MALHPPPPARSDKLGPALMAQSAVDPDVIFQSHPDSCNLHDVFGAALSQRGAGRRNSSGNWTKDELSAKASRRRSHSPLCLLPRPPAG